MLIMALHYLETELAYDAINEYYYDDEKDALIVHTKNDPTKLFDSNQVKRNSGNNGWNTTRTMREIAEIDMVTVHRLLVEHNIDVNKKEDMPRLKEWLRDRDNRKFVTCSGKF